MPLNFTRGEDDITARVKTIPGIDVYEGEYMPDSVRPETDQDGMFVPYVTIKFNGAFPIAKENGIVGPDKDSLRASISIYIVAPDSRVSRLIRDQVQTALLTDFMPTDGGPMIPAGSISFMDVGLGYKRYISSISFSYVGNLS